MRNTRVDHDWFMPFGSQLLGPFSRQQPRTLLANGAWPTCPRPQPPGSLAAPGPAKGTIAPRCRIEYRTRCIYPGAMPGYVSNVVRSADGTTIGYRQYG